jgi:hypothetical protein
LYVKTWNGVSWALVGSGSLNRTPGAGWAFHPSLVPDAAANKLYLAWVEQTALGVKARVFVSEYANGAWTSLGGLLNADPVQGSAQRVSLGIFNGRPVAAWGEINLGAQRQIYVKQWTGSGWSQLAGAGGPPDTVAPTVPATPSATPASSNQINIAWGPSTDLVGVTGYFVYRGGVQIADVTWQRSYSDTGLAPSTSYSYTIAAHDAAGNRSNPTQPVSATTASNDPTPPVVSMTAPANSATVSGTLTVSASATDNVAVSAVQFKLDGANLGSPVTGTGPSYAISWNSTSTANGSHTLTAVATDAAGNTASSSVTVSVNNVLTPPVISGISATSVTSSGATIVWNTDKSADSQVAYGTSSSYGFTTTLNQSQVTSHSVNLSGLAASTTYHYQVLSRDAQGSLATSGDFTFTTAAPPVGPQPVFQLHADASEVSGLTNGSVITPAVAPAGLTGALVVKGAGSLNFGPGRSGNGAYFLSCCSNTNNAYYKFSGSAVGNLFNVNKGKVEFYLTSRYSFAQRKATASGQRYAFDVRDANGHLFSFATRVVSGYLELDYMVGGASLYYFAPPGTEDTLFGLGVTMKVSLEWDGTTAKLYLNDALVKSTPYTKPTPSWTVSSVFNVGAYEYLTYGGYNSSDDIIDELAIFP